MNEDDEVEPEDDDEVEPEDDGKSDERAAGAEIEPFKIFGDGTGFKGVGLEGTGFKGVNMEGFAGLSAGIGALLSGSEVFKIMQTNLLGIGDSLSKTYASSLMPSFDSISALFRYMAEAPALTRSSDYAVLDEPESAYSSHMESPQSYFQSTEEVITCFDDLHAAITKLISKTPDLPLVWRGVRNAEWGMHSHLYRHLMNTNKVVPPQRSPKKAQPYPDEDQMVAAEREILSIARRDWRFDNMSALETFARIQHAGGPTRLIDVTKNPYIGAWFAVEFDEDEEGKDARLFALATRPVAQDGSLLRPTRH